MTDFIYGQSRTPTHNHSLHGIQHLRSGTANNLLLFKTTFLAIYQETALRKLHLTFRDLFEW